MLLGIHLNKSYKNSASVWNVLKGFNADACERVFAAHSLTDRKKQLIKSIQNFLCID